MNKKVLVVAAHPDDEVLGLGGTIVNHQQQGDDVYLCIVTKAYTPEWSKKFIDNRSKEIVKASKILKIKEIFYLNFPTVKLDTVPQKKLNKSILKIISQVNPEILYLPYKGDLHKDHRLVFEASMTVTRPVGHQVARILCYETLSETDWGQSIEVFIPNVYVDISKTFKTKIKAMQAYASELKTPPHPRSIEIIEILAKKRGSEIGAKLAEAFMLIKEFNKPT